MTNAKKIAYANNTTANLDFAHSAIMAAIANGGILPEELSDIFTLTKSAVSGIWIVNWA